MKTVTLVTLAFLCTITGYGQVDTIDISKYRLPDFKFQTLQIDGNINQRMNTDFEETVHNYSIQPRGSYFFQENTTSRQRFISASSSGSYISRRTITSQRENNTALRLNYSHTDLYHREKSYIEVAPRIFSSYTNNVERRSLDAFGEIFIGFGKGRIEDVRDMTIAYFTIKSMRNNGILKRDLSQEEMESLATIITQARNQRLLDFRIMRINEIERIDSIFRKNDWVHNFGPKYFTALYDIRYFGITNIRNNGNRWSIGILPSAEYLYSRSKEFMISSDLSVLGLGPSVRYISSRPISVKWQRDVSVTGEYIFSKEFRDESANLTSRDAILNARISYGYFPNTRTNMSFAFNTSGRWRDAGSVNFYNLNAGITANVNYFISPYVRLRGSFRTDYSFSDNRFRDAVNGLSEQFNATLTYFIF